MHQQNVCPCITWAITAQRVRDAPTPVGTREVRHRGKVLQGCYLKSRMDGERQLTLLTVLSRQEVAGLTEENDSLHPKAIAVENLCRD